MLHPSYTDLMKVVNKDVEEGETKVVNSRYSKPGEKPLSIAISEMNQGKITILAEEEAAKLVELEAKQAEENAEEDFLNIQEEDSEEDAEAVEESEDNE